MAFRPPAFNLVASELHNLYSCNMIALYSRLFRRVLLILMLGALSTTSHAHQLQVEPIVAVLRPQQRFLSIEFTGNVQDITQSVEAKPTEKQGDRFVPAMERRVLAYFNERFQLERGGDVLPATFVALTAQGNLDPTKAKFRLSLRYDLPDGPAEQPLMIENRLLDYLPNSRVIVSAGGTSHALAHGERATFDPNDLATNLLRNLKDFTVLGVEHIFTGPDHLLFIVALLLVSTTFLQLAKTLTGFTIAHSVTLVLSALAILVLDSRLTDILVALSIVYVGAENIWFARRASAGEAQATPSRHRFVVASAFGLVHGFGFSGVLREIGLPEGAARFWSLLAFNVGVEIAQIIVCAIAFPVLMFWKRGILARGALGPKQWLSQLQAASALVVLAGGKWLVERVFLG